MHLSVRLILSTLALLVSVCSAQADKAILILDASGSMWGQLDGQSKIQIARKTVNEILSDWPAKTELGLVAYGHREKANCSDIETLVPVGKVNASAITDAVNNINPKGKTPLTDAIKLAAKELRSTEEKATVILLSDGLETCEADPCAAASELEKSGIDFTVHIIGFGTSSDENKQLQCLADNTGGRLLSASNASELKQAMAETIELVEKASEPTTTEIQVQAPPVGWVSLKNSIYNGTIYDGDGNKVGEASKHQYRVQLPVGAYKVKIGSITMDAEVKPGQSSVLDVAPLVGWVSLKNSIYNGTIYDGDGNKVGEASKHQYRVQLPVGPYNVKIGSITVDVEVKANEHKVINLGG